MTSAESSPWPPASRPHHSSTCTPTCSVTTLVSPAIDPRDPVEYDEALRAARRDAVGAILDSGGIAELLRLGATVNAPGRRRMGRRRSQR